MKCFLFQRCSASKLWIPVASILLSIPKSLSFFSFFYNLVLVWAFFIAVFLAMRAFKMDGAAYLAIASKVLSITFVLATSLLFADSYMGFGGVLVSGLATILIYYAIVLLAYHLEFFGSELWGVAGLLLWYVFYFQLLTLTL